MLTQVHATIWYPLGQNEWTGFYITGCSWEIINMEHRSDFGLTKHTLSLSLVVYSISQEICTRFLLCCALLWLYIDWFSHIHQAYLTGTVAIVRQSNDCPSASKVNLMNMDKYFMWLHYERLHNHNKAKHNKTVCIFLGIYCTSTWGSIDHALRLYMANQLYMSETTVKLWSASQRGVYNQCVYPVLEKCHTSCGSSLDFVSMHYEIPVVVFINIWCLSRDRIVLIDYLEVMFWIMILWY